MTGKYQIIVKNARIQYKFEITRNITLLRGDSATGKTTLIDMIALRQNNGDSSGVEVICEKKCVVLETSMWQIFLQNIHDSIVFIDEGAEYIRSAEFAREIRNSDNYYVIATRHDLYNLPYSLKEIYGIKNTSGNRYQGTKRLYAEIYPLIDSDINTIAKPDIVICEDSNSGFEFFSDLFGKYGIPCISAKGNTNIPMTIKQRQEKRILVIADGAAIGAVISQLISQRTKRELMLYMPESFEWLILSSGIVKRNNIKEILEAPYNYVESKEYFSWERFFTDLITRSTEDTYLKYKKDKLNKAYLQDSVQTAIMDVMPDLLF